MIVPSRSYLDATIKEDEVVFSVERGLRDRNAFDSQRLKHLETTRPLLPAQVDNIGTSNLQSQFTRQIDQEIRELSERVDRTTLSLSSISTPKWNEFRNYILNVLNAEKEVQRTQKEASEQLPQIRDAFRRQIEAADCWLDFRLPAEDLAYREAVSALNSAKADAFEFYQKEQQNLEDEHKQRLKVLESLVPGSTNGIASSPPMSPMSLSSPSPRMGGGMAIPGSVSEHSSHHNTLSSSPGLSNPPGLSGVPGSPGSPSILGNSGFDLDAMESIRGPFAAIKYVNYLSNGSKGAKGLVGHAVYGSPLKWKSGVLGKHIVTKADMFVAPPPIFVEANQGAAKNYANVECAWRLEALWASTDNMVGTVKEIIGGSRNSNVEPLEKGWLLAFILVNLPKPLIPLSESQQRKYKGNLPRNQIGQVLQTETEEHEFFRNLWSVTNPLNIKFGAVAITQAKGTEQIVSDIRSKWQIEVHKPLPLHRKWMSEDEGSGRRRLSTPTGRSQGQGSGHQGQGTGH